MKTKVIVLKDGKTVRNNQYVISFLKAVYNLRMPVSRYTEIWDVNIVLIFFKEVIASRQFRFKRLNTESGYFNGFIIGI